MRCDSLREITIPFGITKIDFATFEYCKSLTKVRLPQSITKIEHDAFWGCTNLTDINIPESLGYEKVSVADFLHCFVGI